MIGRGRGGRAFLRDIIKQMRKTFFDLFPPPHFMLMSAVGLSLSDTTMRFVELKPHEGGWVLGDYAERPLPDGAMGAGYINEPEKIIEVIKDLQKKYNLKFARITLPEEKAFVFRTHVPLGERSEMKSSVEFTLEENVPLSPEEAVFDFMKVPVKDESVPNDVQVSVVAVPSKVVETYLALFKDANITIVSCELESQAIARSIIPKDDKGVYLVLNLEREKTGFYISIGQAVQFTSTMSITPDSMSQLCDEISKIYWHAHGDKKDGIKIEKIYLCGENATREGVKEQIFSKLGIEVEVANVWRNVFVFDKYVPDISQKDSLGFGAAVGLALPE